MNVDRVTSETHRSGLDEGRAMRPPYSTFEHLGFLVAILVGAAAPLLVVGALFIVTY